MKDANHITFDMNEHMAVCYGSINEEGIFAVADARERLGFYLGLVESIKNWIGRNRKWKKEGMYLERGR